MNDPIMITPTGSNNGESIRSSERRQEKEVLSEEDEEKADIGAAPARGNDEVLGANGNNAVSSITAQRDIGPLRQNDVLLGRGTGPNEYVGNVRFRTMVRQTFLIKQKGGAILGDLLLPSNTGHDATAEAAATSERTKSDCPPPGLELETTVAASTSLGSKVPASDQIPYGGLSTEAPYKLSLAYKIFHTIKQRDGRFLEKANSSPGASSASSPSSPTSSSVVYREVDDCVAIDKIRQSFRHQMKRLEKENGIITMIQSTKKRDSVVSSYPPRTTTTKRKGSEGVAQNDEADGKEHATSKRMKYDQGEPEPALTSVPAAGDNARKWPHNTASSSTTTTNSSHGFYPASNNLPDLYSLSQRNLVLADQQHERRMSGLALETAQQEYNNSILRLLCSSSSDRRHQEVIHQEMIHRQQQQVSRPAAMSRPNSDEEDRNKEAGRPFANECSSAPYRTRPSPEYHHYDSSLLGSVAAAAAALLYPRTTRENLPTTWPAPNTTAGSTTPATTSGALSMLILNEARQQQSRAAAAKEQQIQQQYVMLLRNQEQQEQEQACFVSTGRNNFARRSSRGGMTTEAQFNLDLALSLALQQKKDAA